MSRAEQKYYNAFNLIPEMGPLRFKKLYTHFGSMEEAWKANVSEIEKCGLEKEVVEKIDQKRKEISPDEEFEKLEKEGIKVVTINEETYPQRLKEIHSAPALLYFKGEIKRDELAVAIVGSRKASVYGKQVASQLARELSETGITIVSGMAFGIDGVAHRECINLARRKDREGNVHLASGSNRTIAVLGGGIDIESIYPSSNRQIAEEIVASGGCILSEYPIGTPPLKQHFPARNRIISGLSLGVLVIEASISSGALITAKFALEQDREVFAVPGNIYSKNSEGTNNLIKLGAKLVSSSRDVLEELNLQSALEIKRAREVIPDSEEEALILKNLSADEPIHIDKLAKIVKMNTAAISSLLTLMEIKGKVKNVGGMRYVIAK